MGTFTLCNIKVTELKCEMILQRQSASSRKSRNCSDWNLIENTIQTSLEIQDENHTLLLFCLYFQSASFILDTGRAETPVKTPFLLYLIVPVDT